MITRRYRGDKCRETNPNDVICCLPVTPAWDFPGRLTYWFWKSASHSMQTHSVVFHCWLSNLTEESAYAVRFSFIVLRLYHDLTTSSHNIQNGSIHSKSLYLKCWFLKAGVFAFMYCNLSFHMPPSTCQKSCTKIHLTIHLFWIWESYISSIIGISLLTE